MPGEAIVDVSEIQSISRCLVLLLFRYWFCRFPTNCSSMLVNRVFLPFGDGMIKSLLAVCCAASLSILVLLGGCVTSAEQGASYDVDEMMQIAGVTDHQTQLLIKKYFATMEKNKAIALDPFNMTSYWWSQKYRSEEKARKAALTNPSYVLFVVNNTFVWEEELAKYKETAMGQGMAAYYEGRYVESEDYFKQELEINGPNAYVYNRLGWLYLGLNESSMAMENFRKSMAIETMDYSRMGLAEALLLSGEADEALEELKKLSSTMSYSEKSHCNLVEAMCHASKGEYEETMKVLKDRRTVGIRYSAIDEGALVTTVYPGGPAALAGLKTGDLITVLNGTSLKGKGDGSFSYILGKIGRAHV